MATTYISILAFWLMLSVLNTLNKVYLILPILYINCAHGEIAFLVVKGLRHWPWFRVYTWVYHDEIQVQWLLILTQNTMSVFHIYIYIYIYISTEAIEYLCSIGTCWQKLCDWIANGSLSKSVQLYYIWLKWLQNCSSIDVGKCLMICDSCVIQ